MDKVSDFQHLVLWRWVHLPQFGARCCLAQPPGGQPPKRNQAQGPRGLQSCNTDESRRDWPHPKHRLTGRETSFPVLNCSRFLKSPLSFQRWHEAAGSPGLCLSFVCPTDSLFPFCLQWPPFGQGHSNVVTGVGSLWPRLLWKGFWSDQMALWKLKLNCLHFLSFYFNIPAVPACQGLHRQSAIHQFKT